MVADFSRCFFVKIYTFSLMYLFTPFNPPWFCFRFVNHLAVLLCPFCTSCFDLYSTSCFLFLFYFSIYHLVNLTIIILKCTIVSPLASSLPVHFIYLFIGQLVSGLFHIFPKFIFSSLLMESLTFKVAIYNLLSLLVSSWWMMARSLL